MTLPAVRLDDRSFQQLVTEARERVSKSCPEWTDHNVSDPGITLIELFAWMTDMLVYRINRVPDKLHVQLLDLLGVTLDPPTSARADVRFRLATAASEPVHIPAGHTEVATERTLTVDPVVFQVAEDVTIPPIRPVAYVVERSGARKDVGVVRGVARPTGTDRFPFDDPPRPGDALYLGFDEPIARLVLQLPVQCSVARGAGVDPEHPPLRWEASAGDDAWHQAELLYDSTGGFNYGSGTVELEVPGSADDAEIDGRRAHWLRCVVTAPRSENEGAYEYPPEIDSLSAAPIGALVPTYHAVSEGPEVLGTSDGTPGQTFSLSHAPVLMPTPAEHVQVLDPETGAWEDWERRESFAESEPHDRHYRLDLASGEVLLGPAVRSAGGAWRQYGAIPVKGATVRATGYRHGGGRAGNVAAGALEVLRSAIPGVASVSNPRQALGGVDAETLDNARLRAAMEYRTRDRAVTAQDFEFLCGEASPRVARAHVVQAQKPGDPVRVHILPRVEPADVRLTLDQLVPDIQLLDEVAVFLDRRRPLGISVDLLPAKLRGILVTVDVQVGPQANDQRIRADLVYALTVYINPLIGGSLEGPGTGWEFGRTLNQGELYGIAHAIPGVEFVRVLRLFEVDPAAPAEEPRDAGSHVVLEPGELVMSGDHKVRVTRREL